MVSRGLTACCVVPCRQHDGEPTAHSRTCAGDLHAAGMRLYQSTHYRKLHVPAALSLPVLCVSLRKKLEQAPLHGRRKADAGVANADTGLRANALHGKCNVAAIRSVPGRTCQQVQEHLLKARDVGVHPQRDLGKVTTRRCPCRNMSGATALTACSTTVCRFACDNRSDLVRQSGGASSNSSMCRLIWSMCRSMSTRAWAMPSAPIGRR